MSKHAFLIIVSLLYVAQACVYIFQKNYPLAIVIGGYVIANTGLIWSAM